MNTKKSLLATGIIASVAILSGCSSDQKILESQKNVKDPVASKAAENLKKPAQADAKSAQENGKSAPSQEQGSSSNPSPGNQQAATGLQAPSKDALQLINQYDGATLHTNLGDITVKFYGEDAPVTVENFLKLTSEKFYDGTRFHRVIKDFMIQGGDPNSKDDNRADDGMGGPGYAFDDEINTRKLVRGSLAMANSGSRGGKGTNGSQFFIVTKGSTPWLDGKHTNFGEVTSGMDIVDKIEASEVDSKDHPLQEVTITSIDLIEKK